MKLKINYMKKKLENSQICVDETACYWTINGSKKNLKKYLETSENRNITSKVLWEAVRRRKSKKINVYLKKQEKSQVNDLTLHLMELEKEDQMKPTVIKRKNITQIRVEINKMETKMIIGRSMKFRAVSMKR